MSPKGWVQDLEVRLERQLVARGDAWECRSAARHVVSRVVDRTSRGAPVRVLDAARRREHGKRRETAHTVRPVPPTSSASTVQTSRSRTLSTSTRRSFRDGSRRGHRDRCGASPCRKVAPPGRKRCGVIEPGSSCACAARTIASSLVPGGKSWRGRSDSMSPSRNPSHQRERPFSDPATEISWSRRS